MRSLSAAIVLFCLVVPVFGAAGAVKPLVGKKVLMVVAAENFRDEELFDTGRMLVGAGAHLVVASTVKGEKIKGMLGGKTVADILLKEVKITDYDAIVFVGGSGASQYWDDETAHKLAVDALAARKLIAAICIAPVTLARAGLLKGKKATCWPGTKGELEKAGAIYIKADVAVTKLSRGEVIVTASGPKVAGAFGRKLVELLNKKGGR